jgi:hypothetical protein
MLKKYKLENPITMGSKIIDEVEIRPMQFGDMYLIKDMKDISMKDIGALISAITGLLEPEVKRLSLKDAGFFTQEVMTFIADFQMEKNATEL